MRDWVQDRADKLLSAMPNTAATSCDRARITTERYRVGDKGSVRGMRQAVRLAASCGDPAVMVNALLRYEQQVGKVYAPAANRAVELAQQLAPKGGALSECSVRFHALFNDIHRRLQRGENASKDWRDVAGLCVKAGNYRTGAIALGNAAGEARTGKQRIELREKALKMAQGVGGAYLDEAYVYLAEELRSQGYPSKADKMLLDAMAHRLDKIIALHGGLPDPASRLDADLLARTGVKSPSAPKRSLNEGDALLAKAYNVDLASLLREWAKRTAPESQRQANV